MSIHFTRRHGIDREAAKARVAQVAADLERKLAATSRWDGDALAFERRGARGRIAVDDREVRVEVELGVMFRALESGIRAAVEERLTRAFPG